MNDQNYYYHYNNAVYNYNQRIENYNLFLFHSSQSNYYLEQTLLYYNNEIYCTDMMFNLNNKKFNNKYLNNNSYYKLKMEPEYPRHNKKPYLHKINNNNQSHEIINDNQNQELIKNKKPKIYKELEINVKNIKDLINLTNKYEYNSDYTYNINLEGLHKIKPDLIDLDSLIGLKQIKESIFDQLIYFIQDLHKTESDFKHTVIYGPPGTGKTLIAKILGNIYSKIGILKNNYFHTVSRGDLIAGYLGQTAIKTKQVIKDALGGVLFIDEAYSLGGENSDNYSKECLDTLCHELSEHKDELMVIIAGYENDLNEYFFSKNKGLDSRFIWRFTIDSYTYDELMQIFIKKIKDIGWEFENINNEWFKNKMNYFTNYGRDMEILLLKTKIVHSKRVFGKPNLLKKITLEDINNGFELFKDNSEVKKRSEKKKIPDFYI